MTLSCTALRNRTVVDTGTAETLGTVDGFVLDPHGSRVSGIIVSGRLDGVIPIEDVLAFGADAITVRSASVVVPRAEDAVTTDDAFGTRTLTDDGVELGTLADLDIAEDGRVEAIAVGDQRHRVRLVGVGSYAVVVAAAPSAAQPG